jgi:hypothetical protein
VVVLARLQPDGAHEQIEPLVAVEPDAAIDVFLHREGRDLDGLERPDVEGPLVQLIIGRLVEQVHLRPHAALQQAVIAIDDVLGNVHELVTEVGQRRPELVLAGEQADVDLIDQAVLALALEGSLGLLGLVGADEVLGQRLADDLQPGFDRGRVVGRAVLAEQELEHVHGHVGADLHLADEVLADHPAAEHLVGVPVERVHQPADRHPASLPAKNVPTGRRCRLSSWHDRGLTGDPPAPRSGRRRARSRRPGGGLCGRRPPSPPPPRRARGWR